MRVTFFGSGGAFSRGVLEAVSQRFRVASVVVSPGRGGGPLRRVLGGALRAAGVRRDPMADLAARVGARYHRARSRDDPALRDLLARLRPDIILIAVYAWILPPAVFGLARLGALNMHTSLLPRHRGPLPLFWIYQRNDRQSGVSAHWVTEEADAGPVLGQVALDVPRGLSVDELYRRKTELAGPLAVDTLAAIERGDSVARPQDETRATAAPWVAPGRSMVDPAWPAERAWHFLAGLYPRFVEPLEDEAGARVRYRGVLGYSNEAPRSLPGSVDRERDEIRLHCPDGFVRLAPGGRGWASR